MQQNEKEAIQVRDKHRLIFNSSTEKYKGRILQYYGDGTLSIFDSAIDAVKCGIEMQLGFQKDPSIPVRIGIHTGDIIFSEEEIIGDSVNVASRLESLAVSGSVFISDKVYDEIKNQGSIKTSLLNEITSIPDNFTLVLDDYHVIDAKPVENALTFLLDHLPPKMHLVITTREDPDLPLSRLRVRGQLTELGATDLRFTPSEAAGFLNQVMGLNLSAEDIAALETRTEGWVAGLQLAALSMQGRDDIPGFIRSFAGDDRYIADYLVEEVLQRQPDHVRSFLLQTSILDRLSGPLCNVVTGQEDGRKILEALERGNLFVVSLDDKRQWYRYHHLFAGVLHARLTEEQPERVLTLHRQASEWYEQNGLLADAIRHALAAEDFEQAADLIELAWPETDRYVQSAPWLGWVMALPDELVRVRPVLNVSYAWALLDIGEMEAGEARLQEVEELLETTEDISEKPEAPPRMVIVDKEQFRLLPATIASARAYLAGTFGDVAGTIKYTLQNIDLLSEDDHYRREEANENSPFQLWQYRFTLAQAQVKEDQGNLDGALDLLNKAERLYYRNVVPEMRPLAALKTQVWIKQGKLNKALDWARERGLSVDDDLSYLREFEHITLGRVLIAGYKSNRADCSILEAMGLLERLLKAAEEGGRIGNAIEILVMQALAHEAQGNIRPGPGTTEACPDPGRAGGLCPNLCGRRYSDGSTIVRSCCSWDYAGLYR